MNKLLIIGIIAIISIAGIVTVNSADIVKTIQINGIENDIGKIKECNYNIERELFREETGANFNEDNLNSNVKQRDKLIEDNKNKIDQLDNETKEYLVDKHSIADWWM
jgi:hypothetical protein